MNYFKKFITSSNPSLHVDLDNLFGHVISDDEDNI
jgi:hypothetical protein